MKIDKEAAMKMLEFLKDNTDECYTKDTPYPPSDEYVRFYDALADELGEPRYY